MINLHAPWNACHVNESVGALNVTRPVSGMSPSSEQDRLPPSMGILLGCS